jgi:hypothetical protein
MHSPMEATVMRDQMSRWVVAEMMPLSLSDRTSMRKCPIASWSTADAETVAGRDRDDAVLRLSRRRCGASRTRCGAVEYQHGREALLALELACAAQAIHLSAI